MNVRQYKANDLDGVINVWAQCGLLVPQNDPVKVSQRQFKVAADLFLVGIEDDGIVATVMGGYDGHCAWINYLAVMPTYQRIGYGEIMMLEIEARLQDKGAPNINLHVRRANQGILNFYSAIGYQVDDVISLGKRLDED